VTSVNVEIFSKYFLTITETISCKITGNNKQIISCNKYCLIYHRYLIFHLQTLFSITHTQGKLKKLFTPSLGKTRVGMMKFQWRFWKLVHLLLAHHYVTLLTHH